MARKVVMEDDINGEVNDDVRTVRFGFEGTNFEIDLGAANQKKLRETLDKFIEHARPIDMKKGRRVAGGGKPAPRRSKEQNRAIREWARAQGMEISDRGQIPDDIAARFEEAHTAK